ncbi:uncharacterized protein LOC115891693 [Sitophilus oryzae]|uniref:Uncharacterized protein LOC115891693 n=1 Tax=Sitophilus oryzae TaxID=7048 RepID=A0A6J2YXX1_SITOR|nr:uncharacterized protein LOC115891693 [Sitophilus oryzae]
MHPLFNLFLLLSTLLVGTSTLSMPGQSTLSDTFKQCLISYQPSSDLGKCVGLTAISRLQTIDSNPEFDLVDGLTFSRDATQEYRDGTYNYADQDPSDLRSIVGTFDHVFGKRAMKWDMSFIYPGLTMRVAPSFSPTGMLEFVLDSNREALNVHRIKEAGTGRLLARQFLVPLLLGFKFNIGTLLPIIFGTLVLIAKKAVLLSKIALIVSSALGLGSLLFNYGNSYGGGTSEQYYHNGAQYHPTTFGSHYKGVYNEEYIPQEQLQYRGLNDAPMDQFKLYGSLPDTFDRSSEEKQQKTGRNFVWSEDEKHAKTETT